MLAHRVSSGLPACSASSAGYTKARTRFPKRQWNAWRRKSAARFTTLPMALGTGAAAKFSWRMAPGFRCPTPRKTNWPIRRKARAEGLSFPLMRAVGLISLATGTVVDMGFAPHEGKGTGESSLLRSMLGTLKSGDVLVADRYYPTFPTIAALKARGIDLVSISHIARKVDFTCGDPIGPEDHIYHWPKPQSAWTGWMSKPTPACPISIAVREFVITIEDRDGRPGRSGDRHHDNRPDDCPKGNLGPVLAAVELRTRHSLDQAFPAYGRAARPRPRRWSARKSGATCWPITYFAVSW